MQGDPIPFYRPLTSLLWWLEFQFWGQNGLLQFSLVHCFLHLGVVVVAWSFLKQLFDWKLATLALCFWTLSIFHSFFGLPSPTYALPRWIDDPEMTVALCILASLSAFLSFLRGSKNAFWWSLAAFWIGILCKEGAYILPLLLALLLWHQEKLLTRWKSLLPFLILGAGMFIFRTWALGGGGFRFGTNGAWWQRFLMECGGGLAMAHISKGDFLPLSLACIVLGLGLWIFRSSRREQKSQTLRCSALWIIAGLIFYGLTEIFYASQFGDTALRILIIFPLWANSYLSATMVALVLLHFWRYFLLERPRAAIWGYGWLFLAYTPLLTAPITAHALYLMSLGWAVWLAALIQHWLQFKAPPTLKRAFAH